ncbi:MAG: glutaminyl-peptide cyclotransferase [Sedimentisphaerales bacterium]|nr:glutaminyl-peptide cyclotransferase [Sedimentisphaerales bacterium]
MKRSLKLFIPGFILLLAVAIVCFLLFVVNPDTPVRWTYKVVNTFAHDPKAFTQGLVFEDGFLYEGTGLNGRSELRKVELETGNILKTYKLPDEFFGEGITVFGDRIIQLTYQSNVGFVYNKETFELLSEFSYPTEGWGLTHDDKYLIMSDGTPMLYFLDPETFKQKHKVMVIDQNSQVWGLNELEYIDGEIYANVWPTERIVKIEPETGRVIGWIDVEGILAPQDHSEPVDVFNGIAYDAANRRLFVTGKFYPKLFEIKLIPAK